MSALLRTVFPRVASISPSSATSWRRTATLSRSPKPFTISNALRRSYASSHSHHDSHHHHDSHDKSDTAGRHDPEYEGRNQLYILFAVAALGPVFWKLTESDSTAKAAVKTLAAAVTPSSSKTPAETPKPAAPPVKLAPQKVVPEVTYVLVGAGTASFHAMQAIKEKEPDANILIIGEESHAPYERPPLSKELWFNTVNKNDLKFKDWQGNERNVFFFPPESYQLVEPAQIESILSTPVHDASKVRWIKNAKVSALDVDEQVVELDIGRKIKYKKILIATGGVPKSLPNAKALPADVQRKVTTYRGIDDFKKLHNIAEGDKTIVVIGGGFLGSELAAGLAQKGKGSKLKVVQVFPEEGNMGQIFPKYLTKWTTEKMRKEGVDVRPKVQVDSFEADKGKVAVVLNDKSKVVADHVVVAVGIKPSVDLAEDAGLELDEKRGGILVNAELEARGNVFAAGDCTSYHDIALGRRRVEHYDHAVASGRRAGQNMVGEKKPYNHQPMFWSDLGPEISYEAVGNIDANSPTVGVWAKGNDKVKLNADALPASQKDGKLDEQYGKGVVFYMDRKKKIVGILMWNLLGKVDVARSIIKQGKTYTDINDLVTLFNVHQ
ncbi:Apoptosis-inducing factor 1, mitochondrial [Rhizophlyctis rosea]|uniref:Apoptosis-inducing factor 1, mitochondrial n=1 Tax=Rhizophlyctis rosea TaxID=64517 RepID=A0AAD5SDQ3_9FUNG|nr:Apoptosis-inducing factor 1, mitochondrial [Rhizophlyctis rosea]